MKDRTWQQSIDEAKSEHAVVEVARDYLATLSHDEYVELPSALRPPKLIDAVDIAGYALELARHECEDQGELQLVQRMAQVMSRASVRLAEIFVSEGQRAA